MTFSCLVAACCGLPLQGAHAVETTITARFRIDPTAGPNQKFQNTTPTSGLCENFPNICSDSLFSIDVGLRGTSTWEAYPGARYDIALRLPGEWRTVSVTDGHESHDLQFRLSHHSLRVVRESGPGFSFAHFSNSSFGYPVGNCQRASASIGGTGTIQNNWSINPTAAICHAYYAGVPAVDGPSIISVRYTPSFGYELRAPNPHAMHSGIYTGELRYTVGPDGEIGYDANAAMETSEVVLRFELDVMQEVKVDFPDAVAGRGVYAQLEPRGGWQAWQAGTMPPRAWRDVPFRVSLSGPVRLHMECGVPMGDRCAVTDGAATIPLDVAISVPGLVERRSRTTVDRMRIPVGQAASVDLNAAHSHVQNQPSLIHISTPGPFKAGATYAGPITLVFDADG
jgi:hypothetical protein